MKPTVAVKRSDVSDAEAVSRLSPRKRLVFSLVAIVLPVLLIEGACALIWTTLMSERSEDRLMRTGPFQMPNLDMATVNDRELFWQLRPNTVAPARANAKMFGLIANADHMRNEPVPVKRGPDDFRVLCLGDSITFGWGVRYEEAYPTVLEDMLRDALPGRRVQVLNGACPGYTTYQGYQVLRKRGLKYQPDVVTIWFKWNDSRCWGGRTDEESAAQFDVNGWLSWSHAFKVASHVAARERLDRLADRRKGRVIVPRMPVNRYAQRLRDMVRLARHGLPGPVPHRPAAVVFILGSFQDQVACAAGGDGTHPLNGYQKAMVDVARELDVPVVRKVEALIEHGVDDTVFLDNGHLDATGQRLVAQALVRRFKAEGLLPVTSAVPAMRLDS